MKLTKGFSLIEVLVAIGIIGVIGLLSSTILTRTYRSTSQSKLISVLKQNAQVTISSIEAELRTAEAVVCYGNYTDEPAKIDRVVVRTLAGKYIKFRFIKPTASSNGYIARQENLNEANSATFCTAAPDLTQEVSITDQNVSSGVSISSGEFLKIMGSGGKDAVSVKLTVGPAINSGLQDATSNINMETTIQIR